LYAIHHVLIRGEFEDEDERLDMLRSLMEAGVDINTQSVNVSIRYISGKCEQNILNRYIDSKHHGVRIKVCIVEK